MDWTRGIGAGDRFGAIACCPVENTLTGTRLSAAVGRLREREREREREIEIRQSYHLCLSVSHLSLDPPVV